MRTQKVSSLRRNMHFTALALVCATIAIVVASLAAYNTAIDEYASRAFLSFAERIETQMNIALESMKADAKSTAYAPQVQTVLFTRSATEYLSTISAADQILKLLQEGSLYTDGIYLLTSSGRQQYTLTNAKTLAKPWAKEALSKEPFPTRDFWTPVFLDATNGEDRPYFLYVMPVSDIRPGKVGGKPQAVCAVVCDLNRLFAYVQGISNHDSALCVSDGSGLLASSRPLTDYQAELARNPSRERDGQSFAYQIRMPQLSCSVVYIAERDALSGSMPGLRALAITLLLVDTGIMVLLFALLMMSVARPLKRLVSDVQAVHRSQYTRIRPARMQEFVTLSDAINSMIGEIESANASEREAREWLYAAKEEQINAQMYAYRTQINPHFLFNALECIRALAHRNGVSEIEEQVRGLSRSYRYLLSADTVVRLSEELRSVTGYFHVLRPQYSPMPTLRVEADPDALACKVLSLTLQPLVENALLHGVRNSGRPGVLLIRARVGEEDTLVITVVDNGAGIPPGAIDSLRSRCSRDVGPETIGEHIGLTNIARRMRLFFGDAADIAITSAYGHYTKIQLRIPGRIPRGGGGS